MTETMSKWDRVNNFINKTLVPMSWLSLIMCLAVVVLGVVSHDYDVWFWIAIAIGIWSAYDVVKYYIKRPKPVHTDLSNEDL